MRIHTKCAFYSRKPFEILSLNLFLRTGHIGIFCSLELKAPSRNQFSTIFTVHILVGQAGIAPIRSISKTQMVHLFLWAQLLSSHWTLSLLNNFYLLSVFELILFIKFIENPLSIFKWHIQPKILPGFYYQMNICLRNNIEE